MKKPVIIITIVSVLSIATIFYLTRPKETSVFTYFVISTSYLDAGQPSYRIFITNPLEFKPDRYATHSLNRISDSLKFIVIERLKSNPNIKNVPNVSIVDYEFTTYDEAREKSNSQLNAFIKQNGAEATEALFISSPN